jgi:hypothetical protein
MVRVTNAITNPSAILTRCSTKSKPSGPECAAHFARKSTQSSVGPIDKDHDIVGRRYSRTAAPRVSHPRPDMMHISRARKHNRQLVRVTKTGAESSAALTYCSTKNMQSGPECAAHFARKKAQSSVGIRVKDRRKMKSDAYNLKRRY